MSHQEKEQILQNFSEAYQAKYGKAPVIEESRGWYKVDDGKNMRLAQLAELAGELSGQAPDKSVQTAKPTNTNNQNRQKVSNTTTVESKVAVTKHAKGFTAKEVWLEKLQQLNSACRLPRGF